jgi:hypothetical protein
MTCFIIALGIGSNMSQFYQASLFEDLRKTLFRFEILKPKDQSNFASFLKYSNRYSK